MCRPDGCFARTRTALGAPPTPRFGLAKQRLKAPGGKNAPREQDGLFDIVRWKIPKTVRRRAASLAVLILRSARAGGVSQARTGVRAPGFRCDAPQHEGEGCRILAKRTQRAFWLNEPKRGECPRGRRTNLRLHEMTAGVISLFPDCYLQ